MTTPYVPITLVSGSTTITLPQGMEWTDRYKRNLVAQNSERAANGANIIEEFQMMGGQFITLVALGDGDEWVQRGLIDQLQALADAPLSAPMTLTYNDGTTYTVRFRYESTTTYAIEATPLYGAFPRESTFNYALTIRLIQAST